MLISQQFFVERNQLFGELKELVSNPLLKSLAQWLVNFRPYDDMRKALNLSSRSIVHEWSTVGIGGIPGYSTYIGNAAKAARFLKSGGVIGIMFSFANTSNDIVNACINGRENECSKVAFKGYSKFSVSTGAGIVAGAFGGTAAVGICAAIGIATAGFGGVACAAIGSLSAGYLGSKGGELLINRIFGYYGN